MKKIALVLGVFLVTLLMMQGALAMCTDSDSGINFFVAGSAYNGIDKVRDNCYIIGLGTIPTCSGWGCVVLEGYCNEYDEPDATFSQESMMRVCSYGKLLR